MLLREGEDLLNGVGVSGLGQGQQGVDQLQGTPRLGAGVLLVQTYGLLSVRVFTRGFGFFYILVKSVNSCPIFVESVNFKHFVNASM